MPIATNFTSILLQNFEINFMQCAPNGLLKYTELCNLLQLTAAKHAELGGISFSDMQVFDQAWVLSKMRLEIDALPRWKDKITVQTWIVSLENSRSVRAFEVNCNGKKIAGALTFWVVFNTKTRKPQPLALPYKHFELFPKKESTAQELSKINLNGDNERLAEKKIMLSDLDIVNHVNNIKYLEWCLDLYDSNLVMNQQIQALDMNFLKELSLNETVFIEKATTKTETIFCISRGGVPCFGLELNRI